MAVTAAQGVVLTNTPFLIKRWEGIATAAATQVITHGEAYSPDIAFCIQDKATVATSSALSCERDTSATTMTVDCEDDGNDTFAVYAIWLDQASGGIS
jgi:hypothetical protein